MTDYPLKYYCKVTGRKFFGRRITPVNYKLIDPETLEKSDWSHYTLSESFLKDEENKKFRLPREKLARKRGVKINSKAFQEYLYGTTY